MTIKVMNAMEISYSMTGLHFLKLNDQYQSL